MTKTKKEVFFSKFDEIVFNESNKYYHNSIIDIYSDPQKILGINPHSNDKTYISAERMKSLCKLHELTESNMKIEIVKSLTSLKLANAKHGFDDLVMNYIISFKRSFNFELMMVNHVKKLLNIEIDILPKMGNNAVICKNGKIISHQEYKKSESGIKTLDGISKSNGITTYYTMKYTQSGGGMQGSQKNELNVFINNCISNSDNDVNFAILICGGNFTKTKTDQIRNICNGSKISVINLDEYY